MTLDKIYLKSIIQSILDKEFKSSQKRNILDFNDRFNFACPVCGDSARNLNAKRCNLYINNLRIICFNCSFKSGFEFFTRKFNQTINPDKKLEIINHLDNIVSYKDYEDNITETSLDHLLNLSDVKEIFTSGDYAITDFKPVEKNSTVYNYLIGRSISPNYHNNIWEAKYWYNSDRWEPIICFLNRRSEKILGVQIRNLKDGKRRMFKIFNYETLYKWIHGVEEVTEIDLNQLVMYNKISYYFNILNVDFTSTITIFEGYLDSLFYPNSIGLIGVNTDSKFLENNNLDIQFFYDNDQSGFQSSEEKINSGFRVFLWKKLFEDIVIKKKNEDPFKLMHRISKIKDLNKLSELVNDPYRKLNLDKFFSRDKLDIKWIPKKEKRVWKKFLS
jgi:hypothetical protein